MPRAGLERLAAIPSTAATIAGAGANLAGLGTAVWAGSGNITASDDARALCALGGSAVSNWLVATNFGFSIPLDAVILGLTGTVEASYLTAAASITAARLIVANAVAGSQRTLSLALTTSDANYTIGGPSELFDYAITPALLNTSTTGYAISMTGGGGAPCTGRVDAMWLTAAWRYKGRVYRGRKRSRLIRL